MNKEFCERFQNKEMIKGLILMCFYLSAHIITIELPAGNFVKENRLFVIYAVWFLITILLFGSMILNSLKQLRLKEMGEILIVWIAVVAGMVVCAILVDHLGIQNDNEIALDDEQLAANPILYAVTVVILGPVVEEVIFRFLIYRIIRRKSMMIAFVVSVLLFSFIHVDYSVLVAKNYLQLLNMLIYLPLGIGTVVLYERNRNLMYPIILHMALNLVAVLG